MSKETLAWRRSSANQETLHPAKPAIRGAHMRKPFAPQAPSAQPMPTRSPGPNTGCHIQTCHHVERNPSITWPPARPCQPEAPRPAIPAIQSPYSPHPPTPQVSHSGAHTPPTPPHLRFLMLPNHVDLKPSAIETVLTQLPFPNHAKTDPFLAKPVWRLQGFLRNRSKENPTRSKKNPVPWFYFLTSSMISPISGSVLP